MSDLLYSYPMLYDALRAPTAEAVSSLFGIIQTHLGSLPESVMDPACGPGTWLEPFSQRLVFTAGNDVSAIMVEIARERLSSASSEIVQGDMRSLEFKSGPFDVVVEVSGAIGMLSDRSSILQFLQSLFSHLGRGGIALLTVHFREPYLSRELPWVCWSNGPVAVGEKGRASVVYAVVGEDDMAGVEWVQRTVYTHHIVGCPQLIQDCYPIKIWHPQEFLNILAVVKPLFLDAVYRECDSGWERSGFNDLIGERLIVLRQDGANVPRLATP